MRTVTVCVEGLGAGLSRFQQVWQSGAAEGEFVTFESMEGLHQVLTPNRWALIRRLQAEGPLAIRELARRLHRDVKRVHEDVAKLKDMGLVEDAKGGSVWVPCDEIRAELTLKRPAA